MVNRHYPMLVGASNPNCENPWIVCSSNCGRWRWGQCSKIKLNTSLKRYMTAATAEPQSGPGCPRPHTEATLASGRGAAEADTGWLTVRLSYIQVEKIIHITSCTKDKVHCSRNYHIPVFKENGINFNYI